MLLSEPRNLVRETGSRKVMYTYRLLRRECQSSLTKLGQILSFKTGELDTPRGLHSENKAAGSPVARAHAKDRRDEVDVQSPISTLQSPRYAKKLAKKERHLPEIVIPSKPDGKRHRAERPRTSRREDDTPRLLKEARRFADSPAISPRSTTTEKLLRRARQTAVVDVVEDASVLSRRIRDNHRRRKTQRASGTGRHKEKERLEDSPLSTTTEHMIRQFRRAAVEDDVPEVFDAKSAEGPFRHVAPEGSVAEGSVLGSQVSAATGSQASLASDAPGATDATGSQNSSRSTALSSVGSTFASSERTSEITQSSLWDSSMTASSGISSSAQSGTPSSVIESSKPQSAPMSLTE